MDYKPLGNYHRKPLSGRNSAVPEAVGLSEACKDRGHIQEPPGRGPERMRRGKTCLPRRLSALLLAGLLCFGASVMPIAAAEQLATGRQSVSAGLGREVPHMEREMPHPEDRHASISQGVKNMVKRAYQLTDIAWTPLYNIEGWRNKESNRFLAGVPYTGIPYGQPHRSGSYVPWQTGLPEFLREIANPDSLMYSEQAVSQVQQNPSPFFSCECSAFVSWAWNLRSRETTHTLGHYGTIVGNRMADLQVGDCMIQEGKHARLVTDITYDADNNISGIEISEERAPAARRFWYLADSEIHPLSELQTEYLDKGYIVLRCNHRDEIGYTHSCAIPMPNDVCPSCGLNPYKDLNLQSWYAKGVAFVSNQGIMAGTGNGIFSPKMVVNRGMFVTILWRLFHSPTSENNLPFVDVKTNAYYYRALRWAYANGYVTGTSPKTFGAGENCTRAQIVTILWKAAGSPAPKNESCSFTDVNPKSYYHRAVCWAVENGIVSGVSADHFEPKKAATRAEISVIIWRANSLMGLYNS